VRITKYLAPLLAATAAAAQAQQQHTHDTAAPEPAEHADHAPHEELEANAMRGSLGAYPMTREASGTAWQPESSPLQMRHWSNEPWDLMATGLANAVYTDSKSGERGGRDELVQTMGMLMAQRTAGRGALGLRAMLSLDPALVGDDGYPLLFQTGETADGVTPLIDRQHPHDLFMELAATYSAELRPDVSGFVYAGLPGEPALGPATFMHRASGMDNPEAPLGHHWLDSTHITFGVVTGGIVLGAVKLEASMFNGREPDEDRYDIETGSLDSWSARASWNPNPRWATQVSFGSLAEPEQLEPGVDIDRTTLSATYHRPLSAGYWQSTLALGRNAKDPGAETDAYLLESAVRFGASTTVFARAESAEKDELFPEGEPLHGQAFTVRKLGVGVTRDLGTLWNGSVSAGVVYNLHFVPQALESAYGDDPRSWLAFVRWELR
jgi:hypothetical protein